MEKVSAPKSLKKPLTVPNKVLMGPGPSNASSRVLNAMSNPIIGHLHTETLQIMDEIKEGIQYIFQTNNKVTCCVSGSGHAGMEAVLCNLIEDSDVILIGVTGIWGRRAGDMAARYGGDVRYMEAKPGTTITLDFARSYMQVHKPVIFFLTQGDSSTGVLQPLEGFGDLCREFNCLLVVDTVASLGGTEFLADEWKVDAVYTGSQKVLGAPPGITPLSFSERAMSKIAKRNSPIKVYYFDINLLGDYWSCFGRPRIYHHTISPTLLYGLREALAMAAEEGLTALIERHKRVHAYLKTSLDKLGLEMYVPNASDRMTTVNAVKVPLGVDWTLVSGYAMKNRSVEVTGGLGPTAGQVFRIGLMGINATEEKVDLILDVLTEALQKTSNFKPKM